jgi:hypothetical protein
MDDSVPKELALRDQGDRPEAAAQCMSGVRENDNIFAEAIRGC